MTPREAVQILMESPFYFNIEVLGRLTLNRELRDLMDAESKKESTEH